MLTGYSTDNPDPINPDPYTNQDEDERIEGCKALINELSGDELDPIEYELLNSISSNREELRQCPASCYRLII